MLKYIYISLFFLSLPVMSFSQTDSLTINNTSHIALVVTQRLTHELDLTQKQTEKIAKIMEKRSVDYSQVRLQNSNKADKIQKYVQINMESKDKVFAELTPIQKQKFLELRRDLDLQKRNNKADRNKMSEQDLELEF